VLCFVSWVCVPWFFEVLTGSQAGLRRIVGQKSFHLVMGVINHSPCSRLHGGKAIWVRKKGIVIKQTIPQLHARRCDVIALMTHVILLSRNKRHHGANVVSRLFLSLSHQSLSDERKRPRTVVTGHYCSSLLAALRRW
jgi:hypothetical protein